MSAPISPAELQAAADAVQAALMPKVPRERSPMAQDIADRMAARREAKAAHAAAQPGTPAIASPSAPLIVKATPVVPMRRDRTIARRVRRGNGVIIVSLTPSGSTVSAVKKKMMPMSAQQVIDIMAKVAPGVPYKILGGKTTVASIASPGASLVTLPAAKNV